MSSTRALAEDIQKRKTTQARAASMEEKMLDGPRLFRISCEAMKAGLRLDYPDADEAEIHQKLVQRLYGSK